MNQVKRNFIYNAIYQILAICIPIITIPYASRVLGADGIGIYSYTYSIAYYFMITAILGLNNYGSREIARNRDDEERLSKEFSSIYLFQLIVSLIVVIVYALYILFLTNEYKLIFIIQMLYVISSVFDINWFYFGIENFKITVTRNSIIKILSLILILTCVKTRGDVWKYTLILSGSTLLSNFFLMIPLRKYVHIKRIKLQNVIKHVKPCVILFIPILAMKIYKVMDKTMIGKLSTVTEVGYYSNADSILNIPMGIIIALGTVMLPHLTNIIANGQEDQVKEIFRKSFSFALFLVIPMMFGIAAVGKDFSIIFLGEAFEKTGVILQILVITMLFMTIANVVRTQYLIPNNKDKEYIISVIIGAVINVILNLIFIPKYGSLGACIGTIAAEFSVMFFHCFFIRKELPVLSLIKENIPFFIKGAVMFVCVIAVGNYLTNVYIKLIVQILIGIIAYVLLNFKYILNFFNPKQLSR